MKRYQFLWKKKSKSAFSLTLSLTIIFLMIMILAIVSNTHQLGHCLEKYAETYSSNVSKQLAKRTASNLIQGAHELQDLAKTFSRMPDEVLTAELIDQKRESMDANRLFILNSDGTTLPQNEKLDDLKRYLDTEVGLYNETHISYLDQNQVVYSTPFKKNGKEQLLIVVFKGKMLQDMLKDFVFEDEGSCCIVDRFGNIIIAPENMQQFKELKVLSDPDKASQEDLENAAILSEAILNRGTGQVILHNTQNRNIIVGYDYVGVCNWILLTVLPQDMFSVAVSKHLNQFIVVAVLLVLVAMSITISIIKMYKRNMQHIKKAALTDTLTNGDNVTAFKMHGEYLIQEYSDKLFAIVYLNNKDFKSYNIRFGINGGNNILKRIYSLLKQSLNEHELLARCDGSSFCLLLEGKSEAVLKDRVQQISAEIKDRLHIEYSINNYQIAQGAYLIKYRNHEFLEMQDWARLASTDEAAIDECKMFDDSMLQRIHRENELNSAFEDAIRRHEFKPYIQPKLSPDGNQLSGGEILVRWEHPKYGMIPPNEFIPLFEKNGKICSLDFYMFEETCKLLKDWISKGFSLPLSVNLSRAHLGSQSFDFLYKFKEIKDYYNIPDKLIELELTESMVLERAEVPFVLKVIDEIQALGFNCSLDDFGYGYSSLTLLKDLNVNTVKLDRQFFINESDKAWIVVGELIDMAHKLNVSVVAEGIEAWSQVEKLRAFNCDLIQGFVYSRPMPAAKLPAWTTELN